MQEKFWEIYNRLLGNLVVICDGVEGRIGKILDF